MFGTLPLEPLDYPKARILMRNPESPAGLAYAPMRFGACAKEPWTVNFIEQMGDGDVFWDVGANVGPYTLVAAANGRPTVALEPGYSSFALLVRNLIDNGFNERVAPLQIALGERTGLQWFNYGDPRPGAASHKIGTFPGDIPMHFLRHYIMVWRLDDLIPSFGLPWPTHLKIDVDGHELPVLSGAEVALSKAKGLMLEMPLEQEEALTGWLAERGWARVARFDERNGAKIVGICYGQFQRVAEAPAVADVAAEAEALPAAA